MSRQLQNLHDLGPIVVAQKVLGCGGAKLTVPWMPREDQQPPNPTVHILR